MKRIVTAFLFIVLARVAVSQTVALDDTTILQQKTSRVGMNIGAIDYFDSGQIYKNLAGINNPGMEPSLTRQIWAIASAGTTTTFTIPDQFDTVPPNYWIGGTVTVVDSQSGGAELGCVGTIASNTGPNYPKQGVVTFVAPTITISGGCPAAFAIGDLVVVSKSTFPTPESWWETGGNGGVRGTVTGGAQLLSDTTDLCATCGTQSLSMNATASGSKATAIVDYDSESVDNIFVLMNGSYQLTFWAKLAAGTPSLVVSAGRGSSGGFNCGTFTPTLTSTWAQYTWNCTASEAPATTVPATASISFNVTGGALYLDNVSFQRTAPTFTNPTVLRDEVIQTLQAFYGPSPSSAPGPLRYWVNQNGETMANWTAPSYARQPTGGGKSYFVGPGGDGAERLALEDYLVICQFLNSEPYLEVPVTFTPADAANLIEFLASPSTTTYGARRAALGQTAPWTSVFSLIHLSFCNECWNGQSFSGQALQTRTSAPNGERYYDYSVRAKDIFSAMRADTYYTAPAFDLVFNSQTATSFTADAGITRAHPDSVEIESYTYGAVSSFSSDAAIWAPAIIDPWEKVVNPTDIRNFYQSVHDYQALKQCGPSGTANCKVNIYEWGQGTISGGLDQAHLDIVNAGAGEGTIMALQPLLNMQYYGILPQSFFALNEYKNGASGGLTSKLWGATIDMGGATNNVRPEFLGVELVNQSIIGPMYSCPITSNLTYNFAGSPNGVKPMPAMNNVPYLFAFCFENGNKRSMVLINTDMTASHAIGFGGTNQPASGVTKRQYSFSSPDLMNEAPTGTATNHAVATVGLTSAPATISGSVTLPAFSVTALDWVIGGTPTVAAPTFTPAAGTYATAQTVSISSLTGGAAIYFTTDGSTPTTLSTLYTGAITVSSSETIKAIAMAAGFSDSSVSSGAYVIQSSAATPTFSPVAGTYVTAQTVAIVSATSGASIFFTTDGTTPTISSTLYTGAITVSASETVKAIAVKAGFNNSAVGSAAYAIQSAAATPTFSPSPGPYVSAQTVAIASSTSGAAIYYTTDGTVPTTSSTLYSGPLTVSASETIKAIAVKAGFTNSSVGSGAYTIGTGTITCTASGGVSISGSGISITVNPN